MEELIRGGFSRVDQTNDPSYYLRYLDTTTALEFMQKLKQQTYQEMGARPGARLLDVGCGAGDDVRALAQIVGPDGWVAGIDNSEQMVTEARKRTEGLDLPVEFGWLNPREWALSLGVAVNAVFYAFQNADAVFTDTTQGLILVSFSVAVLFGMDPRMAPSSESRQSERNGVKAWRDSSREDGSKEEVGNGKSGRKDRSRCAARLIDARRHRARHAHCRV